jgi:hypothetical protein
MTARPDRASPACNHWCAFPSHAAVVAGPTQGGRSAADPGERRGGAGIRLDRDRIDGLADRARLERDAQAAQSFRRSPNDPDHDRRWPDPGGDRRRPGRPDGELFLSHALAPAAPLASGLSVASAHAAAIGTIIGADLGPNLTPIGSVATLLCFVLLGQRGLVVSSWSYIRVGLLVTPVTIAAALAVALVISGQR